MIWNKSSEKILFRKNLRPKQRKFLAEYLKDHNGTQAAIRAGYSKRTANEQSAKMLAKDSFRAFVEADLRKAEEDAGITATYVLKSLKEVAERCMTHVPVMEFDHEEKELKQKMVWDKAKGIDVGLYEFDSTGANRSLELLGKHKKLFTDKTEITGKDGQPLLIQAVNYADNNDSV